MDEYGIIAEKYNLPSQDEFERDFGIVEFGDNIPLVEIRRKMSEKIDFFANLLSDILHPDANMASMYEYKYIDEKKRQKLYDAFRKLMHYSRKSASLVTYYDENEEAAFIKEFFDKWQELKLFLKEELSYFSDIWKDEIGYEDHREDYMG